MTLVVTRRYEQVNAVVRDRRENRTLPHCEVISWGDKTTRERDDVYVYRDSVTMIAVDCESNAASDKPGSRPRAKYCSDSKCNSNEPAFVIFDEANVPFVTQINQIRWILPNCTVEEQQKSIRNKIEYSENLFITFCWVSKL